MKRKNGRPLRYFKVLKALDEIQLQEKLNSWVAAEQARVINYTVLSREGQPCIMLFYEVDDEEQEP